MQRNNDYDDAGLWLQVAQFYLLGTVLPNMMNIVYNCDSHLAFDTFDQERLFDQKMV